MVTCLGGRGPSALQAHGLPWEHGVSGDILLDISYVSEGSVADWRDARAVLSQPSLQNLRANFSADSRQHCRRPGSGERRASRIFPARPSAAGAPVSYTHLDVYKRQGSISANRKLSRVWRENVALLGDASGTVSYTHLDVYKRQAFCH